MYKQLYVLLISIVLIASPALAADHSDYFDGPLNTGQEVTAKCLECHEDAAEHVMKTSHWTWSLEQEIDGKKVNRGKANAINNFCVSINANWPRCTSCHIGYGWKDASFDFNNPENVDCLVCHDGTGTYKKTPTGAGLPADTVDLLYVAKNVAAPQRENCGACHFFGGGGDAVKHGDMDSSMEYPGKEIDVHMDVEGNNFTCQNCHVTENHEISGNAMAVSPTGDTSIGCEGCHDTAPHSESVLNSHASTVACQSCHIPEFAKEHATKTSWDWSTAGQNIKGEKDQHGKPNYMKKKGHFTYGKNIVPTYAWYNGTAGAYLLGDQVTEDVVRLTYPKGDIKDKNAKIFPFKVHTGKQPYDKKNNTLITPKVFGKGGFWKTFDWPSAAEAGMKASGLPFSGKVDFKETEMYWAINHMVSPADEALGCLDCHGDNGRLDWAKLGYQGDPMRTGKTR
jgi:octaheme c-type cytochrome (tetrathionate reductase family)